MDPGRYPKLMEELRSKASALKGVVSESHGSNMCYRTIGKLIILVHKEFSPIKVMLGKRLVIEG